MKNILLLKYLNICDVLIKAKVYIFTGRFKWELISFGPVLFFDPAKLFLDYASGG